VNPVAWLYSIQAEALQSVFYVLLVIGLAALVASAFFTGRLPKAQVGEVRAPTAPEPA
jgi:hypothetical protein